MLARPVSNTAIEIVDYDRRWPEEFARERERIALALGPLALRIEHCGSTSVPGLAAKPVIDIQISVARLQPLAPHVSALARIGYTHRPHPDDAFAPFLHRPERWPHSHHVHLVGAGGDEERRVLAFRDWLRVHPETARRYESLKRELAPRFAADRFETRQAYADAKGDFIEQVLRLAHDAGDAGGA